MSQRTVLHVGEGRTMKLRPLLLPATVAWGRCIFSGQVLNGDGSIARVDLLELYDLVGVGGGELVTEILPNLL